LKRAQLAAGIVGTLTAATLALSTSPAAASGTYSGRAYVYGAEGWLDDWGDEGVLSTSTNTSSNATCLWQKILWADGAIESNGTPFDADDIDGHFGSNTKAATESWQRAFHLSDVDGVVGKETFGAAPRPNDSTYGLWDKNNDGAVDTYVGFVSTINITRDSDGRYHFYDGDGDARIAGYDYLTCD
jgi:peptidoglycan hydrolase-like protein with peptidoglycan-binding domain